MSQDDSGKLSEEEIKEFDEATEHDYECRCSKCLKWWKLMGRGE